MNDNSIAQDKASVQVSTEAESEESMHYVPDWLRNKADTTAGSDTISHIDDPDKLLAKVSANGAGLTQIDSQAHTADGADTAPGVARAAIVAATVASIKALVAGVPHDVHDGRYDYLLPAMSGLVSTLYESERSWENVGQYLALLIKKQSDRDYFVKSCALPADAESDEKVTPAIFWGARLFTVGEFLERPPKQWLVDKVLGVQDFALLYGESGHGKTHAALDFAYTCATGGTFADTFAVTRPLTVAYASGEGIGGLTDRLRAVSSYYGATDVPLYLFSDIPQLFTAYAENGAIPFVAAWQELAQAGRVPEQLDVLILDTLHNATAGADENSAKDAGITQAALRILRDELGCAVLLLHHANKAGSSERGSTALRASCDTVLRAQKFGHSYTLSCEKLKDAEAWQALSFDLVAVNDCTSVRVFWQGQAQSGASQKTRKAQALEWLQEDKENWHTATEVGAAVGLSDSKAVYEYLDALVKAGDVESKGARPKLFRAKSVSPSQSEVSPEKG